MQDGAEYLPSPAVPGPWALARILVTGVAWAYVVMLVVGLVAGVAMLVASLVGLVGWIVADGRGRAIDPDAMGQVARVAGWITFPPALVMAVWAVAYAATTSSSLRRAIPGAAVAIVAGAGLALLGSGAFLAAALAAGWAATVPSDHGGRVALRALPVLVGALLVPGPPDLVGWGLLLVASPVLAAAAVWLLDGAWALLAAARAEGPSLP